VQGTFAACTAHARCHRDRDTLEPVRRATLALALATALTWFGYAFARDRVTSAMLLANPTAYDDRDVVVTGVVGPQQWLNVTVLGNPPYQGWFPAFLLADGATGVWVVVRIGPAGRGIRPTLTVPPVGARVDVYGRFWAVSQSIEMDRPFVLLH